MIKTVYFDELTEDEKDSHESEFYAYKQNLFQNFGKNLELKAGLNILFGDNSCGKSTLLRMIARETFSYEGYGSNAKYSGWTAFNPLNEITLNPVEEKQEFTLRANKNEYFYLEGKVRLDWNGAFTFYKDCTDFNQVLKNKEGKTLSKDFSNLTQLSMTSEGASTINNVIEIDEAINNVPSLMNYDPKFTNLLENQIKEGENYEYLKKNLEFWKNHLKSLGDNSIPTFLLDEPDAHLSLINQFTIWNMLIRESKEKNIQLIVATHSPIPLFYKEANIFSFKEGYDIKIKNLMKNFINNGDFSI